MCSSCVKKFALETAWVVEDVADLLEAVSQWSRDNAIKRQAECTYLVAKILVLLALSPRERVKALELRLFELGFVLASVYGVV